MQSVRTFSILFLFSIVLCFIASFLFDQLYTIFLTNVFLNGVIVSVFLAGVIFHFYRALKLYALCKWIEGRDLVFDTTHDEVPPHILEPLYTLHHQKNISESKVNLVIEEIALKGDGQQNFGKYLTNLLVFLGLIGTFWGLSLMVGSIGDIIQNLPTSQEGAVFIDKLKAGLLVPLGGMGFAFGSSLFGILGSLILSFLDLQVTGLWRRFFHQFESIAFELHEKKNVHIPTRGQAVSHSYLQSLASQIYESLEKVTQLISKNEVSRADLNKNLFLLTERLSKLSDQRETEKNLLVKVAEGQIDFQNSLRKFSDKIIEGDFGLDSGTRNHIRNLDAAVTRLLETNNQSQETLVQDIKQELRILTKALIDNQKVDTYKQQDPPFSLT